MKKNLEHLIWEFLKARWIPGKPLLVGFSGGPDSLALLHAMLEVRTRLPMEFALAHVDHGWREESAAEAEQIREMGSQFNLEVHLLKLEKSAAKGNLEAFCREARYGFFVSLCRLRGYQAVLLGHHADDQAETVLKRTFEGASLSRMHGLMEESVMDGVNVWRPMLQMTKHEILLWIGNRGLKPFHDKTNEDPKYLRARMRTSLLPGLSDTFGKSVKEALGYLGKESAELRQYPDAKAAPYVRRAVKGPWGSLLDLSGEALAEPYEIKYIIRTFCELESSGLSREALELATELTCRNAADKYVKADGKGALYIDRRKLFLLGSKEKLFWQASHWRMEVRPLVAGDAMAGKGWRGLWEGKIIGFVPESHVVLVKPQAGMVFRGSKNLSEWWTGRKVPALLRYAAPVVRTGDGVIHELLTGKVSSEEKPKYHLLLQFAM